MVEIYEAGQGDERNFWTDGFEPFRAALAGSAAGTTERWDCGCAFGDEHGPDCALAADATEQAPIERAPRWNVTRLDTHPEQP